jgi:hypothetical protein
MSGEELREIVERAKTRRAGFLSSEMLLVLALVRRLITDVCRLGHPQSKAVQEARALGQAMGLEE